jgi:hypothetical protein
LPRRRLVPTATLGGKQKIDYRRRTLPQRDLARRTGLTHAQVNAELNRQVGLKRIAEGTAAQLEERLEQADRWLARA